MRLLLALAVAAIVVERAHALMRAPATDFDDAYMYLRYARHALAGQWFVWNPGEGPIYGVTSPLHLVVVTLLRGSLPGLGDAAVLQLASGMAALALLLALAALGARFCRNVRLGHSGNLLLWSAVLWSLLAYRETFVFHARSGMDTMLAALTSTLVVFASLRLAEKPSTARALVVAALGLLAVEARPDNVIIATLCPLLALRLLAPARGLRPAVIRSSALIWAAAWVGLVVADETLKWRLLGTPVPLAFYAKQPGYYCRFAGEFTWNPFWFLEVALATVAPFLVATMLFARRTSTRLLVVLLAPAGFTMVALFSVNQIMGHRGRFFVPSLPLFIVAGMLVTDQWIGSRRAVGVELPPGGRPAPYPRVARAMLLRLACALLALAGGGRALESAGRRYERRAETQQLAPVDDYRISAAAPLPELDSWQASHEVALLAAASPPGTTIALSEHGLVGANAPRAVLIDVLGLHDPIFARHGFTAAELWRRKPDVIWMPHPDHTQMLHDILASEELWRHYVFYPDAFTFGLALRQDGPRTAILEGLLSARWRAVYPGLRAADHVVRPRSAPGRPTLPGGLPSF